MKELVILL